MMRQSAAEAVMIGLLILAGTNAAAAGAGETRADRTVSGVHAVRLGTSGQLVITQGESEGLEITASSRDLARIVTEVRDGILTIGWNGSGPAFSLRPPRYRLTVRSLESMETHSSGSISVRSLHTESLAVKVSSSGGISMDSLESGSLEVLIVSSGTVTAGGQAERQSVRLSSSGDYKAGRLSCRTAEVRVSSSGSATVRASESLDAEVTSSGSVWYFGNPPEVKGNVTSSGRLVKAGP
jgi:hypothetical protein